MLFSPALGSDKTLSRSTPVNFDEVFCKFWNINILV